MPNAQQRISIQTVAVVVDPAFWIDPARNSLHHFGDLIFPVLHPGKVAKRCTWSEKIEKRILQLHLGGSHHNVGRASSPVAENGLETSQTPDPGLPGRGRFGIVMNRHLILDFELCRCLRTPHEAIAFGSSASRLA